MTEEETVTEVPELSAHDQLKEKARQLGIRGFGSMKPETLKLAVDAKLDEVQAGTIHEVKEETILPAEVQPPKKEVLGFAKKEKRQPGLYPFTDKNTGKIGLWRKHAYKDEVLPGDKKFASSYSFVRWSDQTETENENENY